MTKPITTAEHWSKTNDNKSRSFFASAIRCLIRRSPASLLLASLMLFCGCQTSTQTLFPTTGPNWRVQQGQALWRPKSGLPEFGGDLVVARDDHGDCLIQFDKTPMAILSAQITTNRWLIKFPQRNYSFSGHGAGSTRFSWLY
jgi:hypothetical protein